MLHEALTGTQEDGVFRADTGSDVGAGATRTDPRSEISQAAQKGPEGALFATANADLWMGHSGCIALDTWPQGRVDRERIPRSRQFISAAGLTF